ncbi:hypothetical protein WJX73_004544 [Symbiochloris irregularis]|uniref:Uncharacterized protein n=1 Tax=Symbiochloris irregularis TaxID=706552 RepID=A0AAW1PM54_9CHLO
MCASHKEQDRRVRAQQGPTHTLDEAHHLLRKLQGAHTVSDAGYLAILGVPVPHCPDSYDKAKAPRFKAGARHSMEDPLGSCDGLLPIRELFAQLRSCPYGSADPSAFAASLNLDHAIQQDSQEFFKLLLSMLENRLRQSFRQTGGEGAGAPAVQAHERVRDHLQHLRPAHGESQRHGVLGGEIVGGGRVGGRQSVQV